MAAARTALVRTSAVTAALGVAWTVASAVPVESLDAFAAGAEAQPTTSAETGLSDAQVRRINALNLEHECSPHGLAPGVTPVQAVVRVDRHIRMATFDEGWAMHLGEAPGTLVSVCAE